MLNREHLPAFNAAYWRLELRALARALEGDALIVIENGSTLRHGSTLRGRRVAEVVAKNMRTAAAQLRQLAGQLQDVDGDDTVCGECGATIPAVASTLVNSWHRDSCSLHSANVQDGGAR